MKAFFKNRCVQILLVLVVGYLAYKAVHAYDQRADGFTIDKIHSALPYNPAYDAPVTEAEIKRANQILNQPFHYLARGFQCYAFESADGKYVLKFFRHQRLRPHEMFQYIPNFPFLEKFKAKKQAEFKKREKYLFNGMKNGFIAARHETAIIYIHLNKTKNLHQQVQITDKVGNCFVVNMDDVEFMLQEKAVLIKPTIESLMAQGKVDEAKQRLDQIYELLIACAKKGVQDTDGALIRKNNLGFLDDRAIYIDAGKLAQRKAPLSKEVFEENLKRLWPLHKWLQGKYPELADHFNKQRQKAIDSLE